MAKVKNVSGEDRNLAYGPGLLLVKAGELIEVDDDLAASLGEQPANWEVRTTKKSAPAEDEKENG